MLHSQFVDSERLLLILFSIAGAMMALAFVVCALTAVRRVIRNGQARKAQRRADALGDLITDLMTHDISPQRAAARLPRYPAPVCSIVLLNYFRMFSHESAELLRNFVSDTSLEKKLIKGCQKGTRGDRMRALQVLSHLESDASLKALLRRLETETGYPLLVTARGLIRRKAYRYAPDIIAAVSHRFPGNEKLLSDLLTQFGAGIQSELEHTVAASCDATVQAACLESLAALRPKSSAVDVRDYYRHNDERVRAAALSLAASLQDVDAGPALAASAVDDTVTVRIRAAKIACDLKAPALASRMCGLLEDPVFWVRFWAARALWNLGESGRTILTAISHDSGLGAAMASDFILEMETAND